MRSSSIVSVLLAGPSVATIFVCLIGLQLTIAGAMGQIVTDAVAHYLAAEHPPAEDLLEAIGREGRADGLPLLDPASARVLRLLAVATGARRILEIGTAIGYSALWMAQALPTDGVLISLELDPDRATRARANFERAGLAERISVIVGDASRYLHKVAGPFDLVFQDGAKALYEPLRDRLVTLLRPGGLLVSDNVLWRGRVADPGALPDEETALMRAYNRALVSDPRLFTTILPIGDGLAVSVRLPQRS
jgi:caffeoyl-CoA O-methyltransferase